MKTTISDYKLSELRYLIDKGEMPECVKNEIYDALPSMKGEECNTPYRFVLVNTDKKRYFRAVRTTDAIRGQGCSISYWKIAYGKLQYRIKAGYFGEADFEWRFGKQFGKVGDVEIPTQVHTKKEVIAIARRLSNIFKF